MPAECKCCRPPFGPAISADLRGGLSYTNVIRKYGEKVTGSISAVSRHRKHMEERLANAALIAPTAGVSPLAAQTAQLEYIDKIAKMSARAEALFDFAEGQMRRFDKTSKAAELASLIRATLACLHEIGDQLKMYTSKDHVVDNRVQTVNLLLQDPTKLATLYDGLSRVLNP